MAVVFLNNLDLNGNQLLNARLQNLASDPGSADAGDIIYNTTSNVFKFYNGSAWVDPSTGSYTSWTLSGNSGSGTIVDGATVSISGLNNSISTSVTNPTGSIFALGISLEAATSTIRGGIELFSDTVQSVAANAVSATASRTYGVQVNSSGQAVVNVPWTDNSSSSFTVAGDSGTSQEIQDGDTLSLLGATNGGIDTVASATDTVSFNLNIFDLATYSGTFDSTKDTFAVHDFSATPGTILTKKIAADDIPISSWAAATSTIDMDSNKILGVATPTSSTDAANKAYVDANSGTTYTIPTSVPAGNVATATLTGSDSSTDAVNFVGATNQTKINAATQGSITIGLADNITTVGDLTVGGGDITLSGTGRIQGVDTVTDATDAVNKSYVDNAVVGNLVFQGGYNASTNTPDLDSSPSSSIKKGWSYVVTVAGNFFTEAVEVGDFLIAQQDAPTTLSHWVTVQNNVGLATASTVGIGNVNIDGAGNKDGLALAYSSGTATVGLDINSLPASGNVSTLDPGNVAFPVYDDDASANQKITLAQIQQGISASARGNLTAASTVVTHNLGTRDVIVQLYDSVTYDTVYADVSRTTANTVTIAFASTPSNTVRYMIYSVEIQGI